VKIIGVYWEDNMKLIRVAAHETENHLCATCLNAIRAMALIEEPVVDTKDASK
jgi:hypothetical protein